MNGWHMYSWPWIAQQVVVMRYAPCTPRITSIHSAVCCCSINETGPHCCYITTHLCITAAINASGRGSFECLAGGFPMSFAGRWAVLDQWSKLQHVKHWTLDFVGGSKGFFLFALLDILITTLFYIIARTYNVFRDDFAFKALISYNTQAHTKPTRTQKIISSLNLLAAYSLTLSGLLFKMSLKNMWKTYYVKLGSAGSCTEKDDHLQYKINIKIPKKGWNQTLHFRMFPQILLIFDSSFHLKAKWLNM